MTFREAFKAQRKETKAYYKKTRKQAFKDKDELSFVDFINNLDVFERVFNYFTNILAAFARKKDAHNAKEDK